MMQSTVLRAIEDRENALFQAYRGIIPEACDQLNDLQRDKIAAVFSFHSTAVIGKFNCDGDSRTNLSSDRIFTKYDGEIVYNFGADFVIPTEDDELATMIIEWNKRLPKSLNLISKVRSKVESLGGACLIWS